MKRSFIPGQCDFAGMDQSLAFAPYFFNDVVIFAGCDGFNSIMSSGLVAQETSLQ